MQSSSWVEGYCTDSVNISYKSCIATWGKVNDISGFCRFTQDNNPSVVIPGSQT